jgi:hypothetical protein
MVNLSHNGCSPAFRDPIPTAAQLTLRFETPGEHAMVVRCPADASWFRAVRGSRFWACFRRWA